MERAHERSVSGSDVRVVVLRAAREALEREVEGRREETGGVILGRWSAGGETLVVSGFTGPGPRAVHRACHFSADPEHQQRCLDDAVRRWGAGYVGEWHLHPGALAQPSEWDRQQVRALLEDTERRLDRVVIVIVNQDAKSGPRVFPYLGRLEDGLVVFGPLAWDEVGLRLGGEISLDTPPIAQRAVAEEAPAESAPEAEGVAADVAVASRNGHGPVRRLVKVIGNGLIRLGSGMVRAGEKAPPSREHDGRTRLTSIECGIGREVAAPEPRSLEVGMVEIRSDGDTAPWFDTAEGRQRLADEKRRLERAGLAYKALLLRGGEIAFRFQEHGGGELVAVCRAGYPRLEPRLMRRRGGGVGPWEWVRSASPGPWRVDSHIADVVEVVLRPQGRANAGDAPGRTS